MKYVSLGDLDKYVKTMLTRKNHNQIYPDQVIV